MSFGSQVQAIHETNTINATTPSKIGVIYLQALDTLQGGSEVMNLITEKIISPCKVTPIPITHKVIYIVETLAKKYSIKSPLKLKDSKQGKIHEEWDENYDNGGSISVVKVVKSNNCFNKSWSNKLVQPLSMQDQQLQIVAIFL